MYNSNSWIGALSSHFTHPSVLIIQMQIDINAVVLANMRRVFLLFYFALLPTIFGYF